MIAIIDYDAGNLQSVEKALAFLGHEALITRDKETLLTAEKVILPGVGSFGDAMSKIREFELDRTIDELVENATPLLGICLGLQLLFEKSEESPGVAGLGILEGEILRIPSKEGLKIPHMGWNSLSFPKESRLFSGISPEAYVYFVHSYYLRAADENIVTATTDYSERIHAAIETDTVYACQFHPEKSSEVGLALLKNFGDL